MESGGNSANVDVSSSTYVVPANGSVLLEEETISYAEDLENNSMVDVSDQMEELEFTFDHFGTAVASQEPELNESMLPDGVLHIQESNFPSTSTANREDPVIVDKTTQRRSRRNRGVPREKLNL